MGGGNSLMQPGADMSRKSGKENRGVLIFSKAKASRNSLFPYQGIEGINNSHLLWIEQIMLHFDEK